MALTDSSAFPCAQSGAAKVPTTFPPQLTELQACKLRQRFALAPEAARTAACITFAVESLA